MTTESTQEPVEHYEPIDPLADEEAENFDLRFELRPYPPFLIPVGFHRWPLLIALVIVVALYGFIFAFVDPNPPYFDPAKLPPPPTGK